MELTTLQKQLASQLTQLDGAKIVHDMRFCIPVHTFKVTYHPVLKKPMDILMKMMLLSFQTGVFQDGETVADVLLVEPLFINDLLNKMIKTGLVEKDTTLQLTPKGEKQLAEGVYEEELDAVSDVLQYSPLHESFLRGDIETVLDFDEFPDELSYASDMEVGQLDEQQMMELLTDQQEDEEELNTYVTSILSSEEIQINDVPCLAFILHNESEDALYARVYNTLTNEWDKQLEDVLHANERAMWKERYL
ncbi:nucleoside-diphosphate sugar epimerase [Lysinibacillus sp. KU-BSD001]|uniref:nucleoside-diphosphate sugar epimerase n=1 Tax=Lysinibacillus sp. KU-BSD001 TaxID=3141328 RepID=UPI0036EDADFA